MTVSLAFPEDNDPPSYDRLDGEWRQWDGRHLGINFVSFRLVQGSYVENAVK